MGNFLLFKVPCYHHYDDCTLGSCGVLVKVDTDQSYGVLPSPGNSWIGNIWLRHHGVLPLLDLLPRVQPTLTHEPTFGRGHWICGGTHRLMVQVGQKWQIAFHEWLHWLITDCLLYSDPCLNTRNDTPGISSKTSSLSLVSLAAMASLFPCLSRYLGRTNGSLPSSARLYETSQANLW